ncbi:MAG: hypothetical protein HUJ65_06200, partial [Oscillospiraceae bacterium]|nr:hypothetical protein [Oscillospiraceae bacterium]
DSIEITYYVNLGRSLGTTTPPTEIGNYIAQIEVAGITATCEFSITEASSCYSVKTVSPKDGTLQMYSGDTYMGEYTFARKGSGWTICGEDGLYLTVSNGKLAYSETPTVWTYRNNAFSYSTSSRSFFWFSSGKTYYLTASGVSTRSARITLKEEVSLSEHDFAVIMNRDGTHSHTCNNCGYSETEDCDFSVWTKDTGKNTHSRACTVCGYKETASCAGETECDVCGGDIITESCNVSVNVTKRTSSGWYRRQTTYSVTIKVEATEMKVRTVEYSRDGKRWTRGTSFTSQTAVDKLYIRVNGEKLFYYNGTTVTPQ